MRRAVVILAAWLVVLGAPDGWSQVYLVAAGNNLGDPEETALQYAERDARELVAVMQRLGNVLPQNAVLLLGEGATSLRQVMLQTNARIRSAAGRQGSEAVLVVYYSGHADASGLHL